MAKRCDSRAEALGFLGFRALGLGGLGLKAYRAWGVGLLQHRSFKTLLPALEKSHCYVMKGFPDEPFGLDSKSF